MKEMPIDLIKSADESYQKELFQEAIQLYIKIAFHLIFNADESLSAKTAMDKTVLCYQKIDNTFVIDENKDYIQQYFSVVRHFYDHQRHDDAETIKNEINRDIPLEPCEYRDSSFPAGSTNHHSHKVGPYTVSISTAQGIRDHMEDAHFVKDIKIKVDGKHPMQIFCVLDGHGGAACAQYIAQYLPDILLNELSKIPELSDLNIYNALIHSCILADERWESLPFQKTYLRDNSGSTATIACILDRKTVWVANVGDSGATIDNNGKAIQLTESAKPTIPKYHQEIFMRGGVIKYSRVDSSLDMARSLGDLAHPSVSAKPSIKKFTFDDQSNYLIVACDGLWDVIDAQFAMDAIKGKSPSEASEHLRKLAYKRGSTDNVTILVVGLNQPS